MDAAVVIVSITASAFIATNLDNLVLLVSLLARYQRNRFYVIAGYFCCVVVLALMAFSIAAAADLAPVEYLGLLGLVPMVIGATGIVSMLKGQEAVVDDANAAISGVGSVFVATFVIQLSNGADTVITFGALFADSASVSNYLILLTLAVMAIIFGLVAIYAVQHPLLSKWINQYGPRVTPFILIFVGTYILANTTTDLLPG